MSHSLAPSSSASRTERTRSNSFKFWKRSQTTTPGNITRQRQQQQQQQQQQRQARAVTSPDPTPRSPPSSSAALSPTLSNGVHTSDMTGFGSSSMPHHKNGFKPPPPPGPPPTFEERKEHAKHRRSRSSPAVPISPPSPSSEPIFDAHKVRVARIQRLLDAPNLDTEALRKTCWSGCPTALRNEAWKLLLGYLPSNKERREPTHKKRRSEYMSFIQLYYDVSNTNRTAQEQKILSQISVDVPRTNVDIPIFQEKCVQDCLLRLLYIWSIRHPATGYVQGINDLASPFLFLFFTEALENAHCIKCEDLDAEVFSDIEGDIFWCLSKFLESIQDHYTFAQPGLQKMVFKLQELINRIDEPLHDHLENQNVLFIQFAFRWMNCLLLREIPLPLIIRLWDTYLSSGDEHDLGFTRFHIYVCAAIMKKYSDKLRTLDFQELVIFLQHLPTHGWTEKDIESLLSEAYVLQQLYHGAQHHLR